MTTRFTCAAVGKLVRRTRFGRRTTLARRIGGALLRGPRIIDRRPNPRRLTRAQSALESPGRASHVRPAPEAGCIVPARATRPDCPDPAIQFRGEVLRRHA